MKLTRIIAVAAALAIGGCGRVTELKPAPGESLPVKPLLARATPTPRELLTIPTYAKPDRVDELMKRSEPRPQDQFNLPPPTGGNAPSLPPGTETLPPSTPTSPDTPGD